MHAGRATPVELALGDGVGTVEHAGDGRARGHGRDAGGRDADGIDGAHRDTDGLSGATFAFQWVSSDGGADADIAGATDAGYTLADSDEGRTVRVRVTFTDDGGHEETLTSATSAAVAPRLPPLTAAFEGVPAEHGGRGSEFRIELRFSENFPGPPGLQES